MLIKLRPMRLIVAWNVACAVCVLLPLVVLIVDRIVRNAGDENNGDDGSGGEREQAEWGWGDGPDNEGAVSALFAYFWTLLLFLLIAVAGNYVLKPKQQGNSWCVTNRDKLGILMGATFVFANMAFVLFVVVGGSMIEWDRPEEEGYWSSAMFVPLTFLLLWIFGVVFSVRLYIRGKNKFQDEEEQNVNTNRQANDDTTCTGYACLT